VRKTGLGKGMVHLSLSGGDRHMWHRWDKMAKTGVWFAEVLKGRS